MKIKTLIVICLLSILFYSVVFLFLINKPLTIGIYKDFFEIKKKKMAESLGVSPRLFVLAGSNGLYSHNAEFIAEKLGVPVVNLSMTASFQVEFLLNKYKKYFRQGDILYLPLEYHNFAFSEKNIRAFGDLYMITVEKDFQNIDIKRLYKCFNFFDLSCLLESGVESALAMTGFQRRFAASSITKFGDFADNHQEKAAAYRGYLNSIAPLTVKVAGIAPELSNFLTWAKAKGITVIGGLPTTFDDTVISDAVIGQIKNIYITHGGKFLSLENRSLYPRSAFFDTAYHLHNRAQREHSGKVAAALKKEFPDYFVRQRKKDF